MELVEELCGGGGAGSLVVELVKTGGGSVGAGSVGADVRAAGDASWCLCCCKTLLVFLSA